MSHRTSGSGEVLALTDSWERSVRIRVRSTATAPNTVLLLHGLAGSGAAFGSAADQLDTNRYELVIPDLPGHGRSDHDDAFPYTPSWYTDVLLQLIRHASLNPDAVVGHSMGGTIGLLLAEKLASDPLLINVEGLPESLDFLARRVERYGGGSRKEGYRAVLEELRHATDPGIQAWLEWADETNPDAFFDSAEAFSSFWTEQAMMDRYRAYPAEQRHYVCGADGHASFIKNELEPGAYEVIPGAAHFPMVNNPEAFWSVLRRHLTNNAE